jgi:ABC-type sugar transport system ATPase subunit
LRISDRITALRDGVTVATRETCSTDADEIIRLMVGRPVDGRARVRRTGRGQVVLSAKRVTSRKLHDVSFELHAGEVLGIGGLVGAGRSAVGALLFGLDRVASGEISLRGERYSPRDPADALRRGLGLVPEDRHVQGLMLQMTVRENGTLSALPRVTRVGFIQRRKEMDLLNPWFGRLTLTSASPEVAVGTLSGGNQQKVLLARVLLADPDVLFLDDPARGVDVGAKADIHRIIDELAERGKGILLVSSELNELLHWCDRIIVLREGRVAATYSAQEATPDAIMAAATGHRIHVDRAS